MQGLKLPAAMIFNSPKLIQTQTTKCFRSINYYAFVGMRCCSVLSLPTNLSCVICFIHTPAAWPDCLPCRKKETALGLLSFPLL
jgi:hypothetical protein